MPGVSSFSHAMKSPLRQLSQTWQCQPCQPTPILSPFFKRFTSGHYFFNKPYNLVPRRNWINQSGKVSGVRKHVAVANATSLHLDQDLISGRALAFNRSDLEAFIRGGDLSSLHEAFGRFHCHDASLLCVPTSGAGIDNYTSTGITEPLF